MDSDSLLRDFQEFQQVEPEKKIEERPKRRKHKPVWREYLEVFLISLASAILIRILVVSAYRVDSSSMEDTLIEGDYIFVNKLAYLFGDPEPGDVAVFKYPLNPTKDYIKRIIASPGQTVEIIDKVIYIDNMLGELYPNVKNTDPKILAAQLSIRDNFGPIQVPADQYFVLGDNRDISQDSRDWGFVPKDHMIGKAVFVYWSWTPDPDAPEWEFPYIHSAIIKFFYYLTGFPSKTRWERLVTGL